MKKWLSISILLNLLLVVTLYYVGEYKTDFFKRVNAKLSKKVYVPVRSDNNCIDSWTSCIRKLNLDVDVVFFGDSITEGGEWQDFFPNAKSITLAYIGDDIKGMLRRVNAIASVKPEKVFIMAGINGLNNQSIADFEQSYNVLLDSIYHIVPNAHIYVQSLLPISADTDFCSNSKIKEANYIINRLAVAKQSDRIDYIDLWSVYSDNDSLPSELSYDGLHLKDEAYSCWVNAIRKYIEE